MVVYFYCEGPTDYVVISQLIRKLQGRVIVDLQWKKKDELKKQLYLRKNNVSSLGNYRFITALYSLASRDVIKNIALHQDADRHFRERCNAISEEFEPLRNKGFNCLAIIPKEMIESWLLADVTAINSLGDGTNPVNQSPNPETLWGDKDDPNSNYPKNYLRRNLEELELENNRDTYAVIAKNIDIEVLKRRCPESFGQFYTDMQSFIAKENTP